MINALQGGISTSSLSVFPERKYDENLVQELFIVINNLMAFFIIFSIKLLNEQTKEKPNTKQ